jgi:hypothetical protein
MKYDVVGGFMVPFFGENYSQDKTLRNKAETGMKPEDIMRMDYLVENVIGEIPALDDFIDIAKPVVELKDVEESL